MLRNEQLHEIKESIIQLNGLVTDRIAKLLASQMSLTKTRSEEIHYLETLRNELNEYNELKLEEIQNVLNKKTNPLIADPKSPKTIIDSKEMERINEFGLDFDEIQKMYDVVDSSSSTKHISTESIKLRESLDKIYLDFTRYKKAASVRPKSINSPTNVEMSLFPLEGTQNETSETTEGTPNETVESTIVKLKCKVKVKKEFLTNSSHQEVINALKDATKRYQKHLYNELQSGLFQAKTDKCDYAIAFTSGDHSLAFMRIPLHGQDTNKSWASFRHLLAEAFKDPGISKDLKKIITKFSYVDNLETILNFDSKQLDDSRNLEKRITSFLEKFDEYAELLQSSRNMFSINKSHGYHYVEKVKQITKNIEIEQTSKYLQSVSGSS